MVTSTYKVLERELSEILHIYSLLQNNREQYLTFNFEMEWAAYMKDVEMEVIVY
jgi:hypothetical protein